MTTERRIVTIDCQYVFPRFAAAYLLIDGDRAAFIDNNTAHAVPLLLDALHAQGMKPEQVEFVIITHVHLDHAGGTSQLMQACPRATCLAHPRAAKHLIDPTKLVASARKVYGDEAFDKMYGRIEPIPAARVRAVEDEEQIAFGEGPPLRFLHTRGHANHHMCIFSGASAGVPADSAIFTGDSFGLAYPALQRNGLFIFPTTSPTDFDYAEAVASIDRIVATGALVAYPTHFGAVPDLDGAAGQLREHLVFSQELMERATRQGTADDALTPYFERELSAHLEAAASKQGLKLTDSDRALIRMDLELNAQGLAHALLKRR